MKCAAKHTKYQPTDCEWTCPGCGSVDFYIDDPAPNASYDCELLHDDDLIVCRNCDNMYTGRIFAQTLQNETSVVPCPCCKGTGLVKDTKGKGKK